MCIALQLRSVQHEADRAEQLVRVGLSALTLCTLLLICPTQPDAEHAKQLAWSWQSRALGMCILPAPCGL